MQQQHYDGQRTGHEHIDSPLLFTTESGKQAFVHDSMQEYFFGRNLALSNASAREVIDRIRSIRHGAIFRLYCSMHPDQDKLVSELMGIGEAEGTNLDNIEFLRDAVVNSRQLHDVTIGRLIDESDNTEFCNHYSTMIIHLCETNTASLYRHLGQRLRQDETLLDTLIMQMRADVSIDPQIETNMLSYLSFDTDYEYDPKRNNIVNSTGMMHILRLFDSEGIRRSLRQYSMTNWNNWALAVEIMGKKKDPALIPGIMEAFRSHKEERYKGRILIIDDVNIIQELYSQIMEKEGYQTIGARTGEIGIEYMKEYKFDMIVTDLIHPGLNGQEYMEKLRELFDCPIVVCSSYIGMSREVQKDAKRLGIPYILKPFMPKEMTDKIDRALAEKKINYPDSASYIEEALVNMDPAALPGLRKYSDDPDLYVREHVADFIAKIEHMEP